MLENAHPVLQTFLGTLFTWGMTAAGAGLVFIFTGTQRKVLDVSLGFAAGEVARDCGMDPCLRWASLFWQILLSILKACHWAVQLYKQKLIEEPHTVIKYVKVMTAASFWSLLAPAIEMAENSGLYGSKGQWAFFPVGIGFALGAFFVYAADYFIPHCGDLLQPENGSLYSLTSSDQNKYEDSANSILLTVDEGLNLNYLKHRQAKDSSLKKRQTSSASVETTSQSNSQNSVSAPARLETGASHLINWRRMMLLIIAITIHNIPEGLAVGVGFGAIGKASTATLEKARNLAFGIGIQNFPEGLAVSLPLHCSGLSRMKSFWYGQLSGMVEPIAGLLGAYAVTLAEPILPYSLAFAAGAMIYVVFDDIIPEAQNFGNGKLASLGAIIGFIVMMSLDVGLG